MGVELEHLWLVQHIIKFLVLSWQQISAQVWFCQTKKLTYHLLANQTVGNAGESIACAFRKGALSRKLPFNLHAAFRTFRACGPHHTCQLSTCQKRRHLIQKSKPWNQPCMFSFSNLLTSVFLFPQLIDLYPTITWNLKYMVLSLKILLLILIDFMKFLSQVNDIEFVR